MRPTVTVATWLVAVTVARAEPAVEWVGPASCPTRDAFAAQVEAHLGGPVVAPGRSDVQATVAAVPAQPGWIVQIDTRTPDGPGERRVAGATCAEVADAAALIVAMAIDAAAVTGDDRPSEPPVPPPAGAPADASTGGAALRPVAPAPPIRFALRSVVGSNIGMLPGVEPGFGVDLSASRGPWRGELGASLWMERDRSVTVDGETRGADLSTRAAALRACYRAVASLWVCGGAELGTMRGAGFGATGRDFDRSSTWLAAGATVIAPFQLSDFISIIIAADVLAPVRRPRFLHDDDIEVHQPARVVGRLWAGAAVRIW